MNSKVQNIIITGIIWLISTSNYAQLTPKKMGGLWGYVDSNNEWVIKPKLSMAKSFANGMSAFSKKGKWGYMSENGKVAIKPKYVDALDFSEEVAAVALNVNGQLVWGYINYSGEVTIPFNFTAVNNFKNGQAIVIHQKLREREKVFIDKSGAILSPPFISYSLVDEGKLLVNKRDDRTKVYCYINSEGKPLTDWYMNHFKLNTGDQKVELPSKTGNDQEPSDAFSGNIGAKLYGYLNSEGQLISDWYEEIRNLKGGYRVAKKNHKYGFINQTYEPVTDFKYIEVNTLDSNRYIAMFENATFTMTNLYGEELGKLYAGYEPFEENLNYFGKTEIALSNSRTYQKAIFDTLGIQKSCWYDEIYPKSNQYYRVLEDKNYLNYKKDTLYGDWYNHIVDSNHLIISDWRKTGEMKWSGSNLRTYKDSIYNYYHAPKSSYLITPAFFEEVFFLETEINKKTKSIEFKGGDFHDGMCLVAKHMGQFLDSSNAVTISGDRLKYGFINWYGKLVIPYKFDYVSGFSDGKAIYRLDNKFGAIDYNGRVIIKPKFELMGNFGDGLAPIYKDSLWGYCDSRGAIYLKPQYDVAYPFYYGYAAVKQGKKWGLIDRTGAVILPFDYRKAPMAKSSKKVLILKDGIGLVEIEI